MFQGDSLLSCFDLGNNTGLSSFAEKKKLLSIVGAMNNKEVTESSVFCFLKASLGRFVVACFCYFFFLLVSKTNWYGLNLISCPGRKLGLFLPSSTLRGPSPRLAAGHLSLSLAFHTDLLSGSYKQLALPSLCSKR